jgi:hypothetical protein
VPVGTDVPRGRSTRRPVARQLHPGGAGTPAQSWRIGSGAVEHPRGRSHSRQSVPQPVARRRTPLRSLPHAVDGMWRASSEVSPAETRVRMTRSCSPGGCLHGRVPEPAHPTCRSHTLSTRCRRSRWVYRLVRAGVRGREGCAMCSERVWPDRDRVCRPARCPPTAGQLPRDASPLGYQPPAASRHASRHARATHSPVRRAPGAGEGVSGPRGVPGRLDRW